MFKFAPSILLGIVLVLSIHAEVNILSLEKSDRPIVYTFFQPIEQSECSPASYCSQDEDDKLLLSFWKDNWSSAGWEPVVLTMADAEKHPNYEHLKTQLESLQLDTFGNLSFSRWIAMTAVGGGWYADYDVFSLRELPSELPNNGTMTVYDVASPTLASGSADQWMLTLNALLEDGKSHQILVQEMRTFWTDSLGVLSLMRKYHKKSPSPQTAKRVAIPYGKKDPIFTESGCDNRAFRDRWVVHFGLEMVQSAQFVPPELRLPKHRTTLAKNWLSKWMEKCNVQQTVPETPILGN